MLVLSRKQDEGIYIGHDIKVTIVEITNGQVKIGIRAPNDVSIFREEVINKIIEDNYQSIPEKKPGPEDIPEFIKQLTQSDSNPDDDEL